MSCNIDMHGVTVTRRQVESLERDGVGVLRITARNGTECSAYMPLSVAERIAKVWADAKDAGEV